MIRIEYPIYQPKFRSEKGKEFIFDEVRKQWLFLTPEEWVRQNFIQYLIQVKKYPATLIAIEKGLKIGELQKRTDIIVYNSKSQPWLMVECKEMNVPVNSKVLDQILRYHISIPVTFLVITNGTYCFGFEKKDGSFVRYSSCLILYNTGVNIALYVQGYNNEPRPKGQGLKSMHMHKIYGKIPSSA